MGLLGLCYSKGKLYTVSWRIDTTSCNQLDRVLTEMCVYNVEPDSTKITKLFSKRFLEVLSNMTPSIEQHSQRVFFPYPYFAGTGVISADPSTWRGWDLVEEKPLRCVNAFNVAPIAPDTAYMCDSNGIHVVDVIHDTIKATLDTPSDLVDKRPRGVAVLGNNVMVSYGDTLAIYSHGSNDPNKVVRSPGPVSSISTDRHHYFLLTHSGKNTVSVVNVEGNLCHTVNIDSDRKIVDCTVVNRQLWVGCDNGAIIIMSKMNYRCEK